LLLQFLQYNDDGGGGKLRDGIRGNFYSHTFMMLYWGFDCICGTGKPISRPKPLMVIDCVMHCQGIFMPGICKMDENGCSQPTTMADEK
jgi:hypothetical protein